jgi:hypothetical protein
MPFIGNLGTNAVEIVNKAAKIKIMNCIMDSKIREIG